VKDSFILFLEQEQTVDLLSDEQAGKLLKGLYDMVRGEKISFDDRLLNMAFIPIRQSIERNIEKYQKICDRNKLNGSQGGRPPNNPVGSLGSQDNPENPDGYSGNPPDSDRDPYRVPDPDPDPDLLPPSAPKKRKRKSQVPEDFEPNNNLIVEVANKYPSLKIGNEIQAFKDFHISKGTLFLDFDRAFRTWCRNAIKFDPPKKTKSMEEEDKSIAYVDEQMRISNL